jgi:predicted transposase YbfD/YdcC
MDSSTNGVASIARSRDKERQPTQEQVQGIYQALQAITDHRCKRGRRYELAVVLTVMLLAKLAGEHTGTGIAEWVRLRIDWLKSVLPLRGGPCANTYRYICEQIDFAELLATITAAQVSVVEPVSSATPISASCPHDTAPPVRHLACDGKVLRGSRRGEQEAHQVLGIYDVTAQRMQTLLPIAGKGQEPEALVHWLQSQPEHALGGCLVTADALHTHAPVARAIRHCGGDYLLVVKENQPTLYKDIVLLFSQPPNRLLPEQSAKSVDSRHGRLEVRRLRSSTELSDQYHTQWPDLAQVFQVERTITRRLHGVSETTVETAYAITNLSPARASPKHLLKHIRAHWQIENSSHWRRDATLHEDATKLSSRPAALVMAVLNCTILALLDQSGIPNVRSAMRRFAAYPTEALALILGQT